MGNDTKPAEATDVVDKAASETRPAPQTKKAAPKPKADAKPASTGETKATEKKESAKRGPKQLKRFRVKDKSNRPSVRENSANSKMRDRIEVGGDAGVTSREVADHAGTPREHANDYLSRGIKRGWLEHVPQPEPTPETETPTEAKPAEGDGK